jgi:hypothetical protein
MLGLSKSRPSTLPGEPERTVHCEDALRWLARSGTLPEECALVTSLPDSSEVKLDPNAWEAWFNEAARAVLGATHERSVAVFYQSDVKREGRWVDKSFLVQLAAREAGVPLLFHKIVCRAPAGTVTPGRPAYAHLLCFSRGLTLSTERGEPSAHFADVLPSMGKMTWTRAMGIAACEATCAFLRAATGARVVVDPFCGVGTMLAVANARGFDAIGVELSVKRAALARELQLQLSA